MVEIGSAMPYHIFEINPFKQLTFVESVGEYRDAKAQVRAMRESGSLGTGVTVRMMFAGDRFEAERLLKEKREPRPMGEHD